MSKARELGELGTVVTVDGNNVGIGTASPQYPLHINGGGINNVLKLESTDAGAYANFIDDTSTVGTQIGAIGDVLSMRVGGTEILSVDSSTIEAGVGVDYKLRGGQALKSTGTINISADYDGSGAGVVNINTGGINRVEIDENGNIGFGGSATASSKVLVTHSGSNFDAVRVNSDTVTNDTGIYLRTTGNAGISFGSTSSLVFFGGGAGLTERMRISPEGKLAVGTTNTDSTTAYALSVVAYGAFGNYSTTVPTISNGGTATVDIPVSYFSAGNYEFSFWAYSNGGYYVHSLIGHFRTMRNPDYAYYSTTLSSAYTTMSSVSVVSGNVRIQFVNNGPSGWAAYGGRIVIRRIG